ncbi:helix-turn-helix domain-containing protein [Bacillus cereus group sp. N6]|uniref:helix-turn-helix domain-containing protein n=1 Tax=Bacillus cereus group sp. N6 TaxID=2794583 RepID=UPI0018F50140|nr:helix-turn-helix domain-containing protein [Bacillus cereus group sp. N6]MBJ8113806.1 helix-turn-helix domain-containing protein [Bacillus cereus group sp. N6]
MRAITREIRKVQLKEQYCNKCIAPSNFPRFHIEICKICKIGNELIQLNQKTSKHRAPKNPTKSEIWDTRCKQATLLFQQGHNYLEIAKEIGCHVSSLYRELKKRELLPIPSVVENPKE